MNNTDPCVNSVNEIPDGTALRDEGVQAVLDADVAPHRGHRAAIEAVLDALVESGQMFDADDVAAALDEDTRRHASPNLVGALFNVYRSDGRITCIGYGISTRRSRHAGLLRRWIGSDALEAAA